MASQRTRPSKPPKRKAGSPRKPPPAPAKPQLRFTGLHAAPFEILGAEYLVNWEQLPRGGSFFLPTTATAKQVRAVLNPIAQRCKITLEIHNRIEFDVYGVRVWRTG